MISLDNVRWKPFKLEELFDSISRGKRLKNDNHISGDRPYISSTARNNGVDDFISNSEGVRIFSDCLTIANSGSVGQCFYQPFEFIASDHVTALSNSEIGKYEGLFIAVMMSRLSEKYSFNHEISDSRIRHESIILPSTEDGEPDYAFMRAYMKFKEQTLLDRYRTYLSELELGGGGQSTECSSMETVLHR